MGALSATLPFKEIQINFFSFFKLILIYKGTSTPRSASQVLHPPAGSRASHRTPCLPLWTTPCTEQVHSWGSSVGSALPLGPRGPLSPTPGPWVQPAMKLGEREVAGDPAVLSESPTQPEVVKQESLWSIPSLMLR